jgi:lipoate---protein ligase
MSIPWLDLTLPTAAANLALDEALLLEAEEGSTGEVLRLWEWPEPAVVLGAGRQIAADVDESACAADGVPILRRASGGGTVLLGRGCLLFSIILAYERDAALRDVNSSYRYILERMAAALHPIAEHLEHVGTSDLAVGGLKVSGNAQQRKRHHLLHHGSLLYSFDPSRMTRYLRMPDKQPDYRGNRSHEAFVTNLPADRETLQRLIRSEWAADRMLLTWPEARAAELARDKYDNREWTLLRR